MKILHTVEFYPPSTGGMQEVVRQLSERLVKMGHQVTVATTKLPERKSNLMNGVNIVEFNISGNAVRKIVGDTEQYQKVLIGSDFDIVTNFAAQQWATDLALPILDKIKAKKVFVPTGFSGLKDPMYKDYFEQMKSRMKKYDMNVFLSNDYRDVNFAKENGIDKRVLITNGAGEDEFIGKQSTSFRKQMDIPDDAFLILHVGSYTGIKGHEEALEIFIQANLPNSFLLMVGNDNDKFAKLKRGKLGFRGLVNYFKKHSPKILITSLNREQTVQAYQTADLFLFPSNIECSPIVLFECMASKTPFLTTDVGNAAEIIEWSHAGMLLPTRIDKEGYSHAEILPSAEMLRTVFANSANREEMKTNGFKSWKMNFSWEIIAEKYSALYKSLLLPSNS